MDAEKSNTEVLYMLGIKTVLFTEIISGNVNYVCHINSRQAKYACHLNSRHVKYAFYIYIDR